MVPLCEAAFAELPRLLAEGKTQRGSWRAHEELAQRLLGDDPAAVVAALKSGIRDGATATDLSRAMAYAAALRVAFFGTSNEHSDWDTALHCFTYCNAVHQLLTSVTAEGSMELERPELLRGVFHGAMQVYLIRFLNVPPTRLPGEGDDKLDDLPCDEGELRDAFLAALDRQGAVKMAGRLVARYLIAPDRHAYPRGVALRLACKYWQWSDSAAGRRILIAVARYIAPILPLNALSCRPQRWLLAANCAALSRSILSFHSGLLARNTAPHAETAVPPKPENETRALSEPAFADPFVSGGPVPAARHDEAAEKSRNFRLLFEPTVRLPAQRFSSRSGRVSRLEDCKIEVQITLAACPGFEPTHVLRFPVTSTCRTLPKCSLARSGLLGQLPTS